MWLAKDSFHGISYFVLHTILCMLCLAYPGVAARGSTGERDCPKMCFCNKLSKIVYCSRRGLPYIPNNIPSDALQLNLNFNTFVTTVIQRSNFSRFPDMEHLYLSECGIEVIEVDTFRDLANLKWLDLSNNRIKFIQDNTFRGLNLRHLFLNGNRDMGLTPGSFEGLVTSGLYLHECSLKNLDLEILSPLNNTLGYLWLNGNELERVSKGFASVFESLSHLRLGSNPLHCNCEVLWLKEFYDKHSDVFEGAIAPSCLTPAKLRGKFFNELSLFDLKCQSPVFGNIDAQFDSTRGRLKCTATGDPAPTLYWIQPTGMTSRYLPPVGDEARRSEGILNITGTVDTITEKSGMYICVANNEAGNVTLTINISFPNPNGHDGRTPYKTLTVTSLVKDVSPHIINVTPPPGDVRETTTSHIKRQDTPKPVLSTSQRDQRRSGSGTNYTAICNMLDFTIKHPAERLFNLTELIGAVIGTFVCTLLVCLIFMPIYYRRKIKQHHTNSLEKKKPPPPEKLFLNGLGHHQNLDYMETPTTSPKR